MRIGVAIDTSRLRQDLDREKQRIRNAARRTAYELAHRAVADVKDEMRRVFDRPTPWVLGGVYVAPVRSEDSATVAWKPGAGNKATPAEKILRAQVEGGPRSLKRFERLLDLPANRIAVPAKWAELDAYGNMSRGQLVKILSHLRVFGEQGYMANRRNRSTGRRRREDYFIIRPGSDHRTLSPGIYRVAHNMGGAPLMVIAFVRAANYRARFAPADVVRRTVARDAAAVWNLALQRNIPFRR
jgi:hypothetical protein